MELTLSSSNPLKTVFTDPNGNEVYRVETLYKFLVFPIETTISSSGQTSTLAKIHWRYLAATTIEYRGNEVRRRDFIDKKECFGLRGTFTASDGLSYKWISGIALPNLRLESNDDKKTLIARFSRSTLGIFGPKRKASLEILSDGMHIMDDIVLTVTYMNEVRRERKKRRGG